MPHHAGAGVRRQNAAESPLGSVRPIGDDHHARVDRVTDPDPAAVVDRHPRRAAGGVDQGVQDRPVGDRVRAVAHAFRFPVG